MLKRKVLFSIILLLLSFGCSSKKVTLDSLTTDMVEVNRKVEILNKKLMSKEKAPIECKLQKKNILQLQKENSSVIDKVFEMSNLLSDADLSSKHKKEIEYSLDNALKSLFILRKESRDKLLALKALNIGRDKEYLCSLEIKPVPKVEACPDCVAVFN